MWKKKVSLRIDADLLRLLDGTARRAGRSRSNLIAYLLSSHPAIKEPLAELRKGDEKLRQKLREAEATNARELQQAREALTATGRLRVRGSAP